MATLLKPYKNAITILNQDGILFHHKPGSEVYINKYLEDERRKQFPYFNISTHYSKEGIFKKIAYTNQLLDFEKPYIRIGDDYLSEIFVVKDNNQALLIDNIIQPNKYVEHMTYAELLQLVSKNDEDEQIYYVYLDGSMNPDGKGLFLTEEKIYNYIREQLLENFEYFEREKTYYNSQVAKYLKENPWFLSYVNQSIREIDLSLIDFNVPIGYDSQLLVIRINKGVIKIQGIKAIFVKQNDYKVDIYDIPVTKYSLEQLKYMKKIDITEEPRIPLKLNHGVTRQDIEEAKQMINTLRK